MAGGGSHGPLGEDKAGCRDGLKGVCRDGMCAEESERPPRCACAALAKPVSAR